MTKLPYSVKVKTKKGYIQFYEDSVYFLDKKGKTIDNFGPRLGVIERWEASKDRKSMLQTRPGSLDEQVDVMSLLISCLYEWSTGAQRTPGRVAGKKPMSGVATEARVEANNKAIITEERRRRSFFGWMFGY